MHLPTKQKIWRSKKRTLQKSSMREEVQRQRKYSKLILKNQINDTKEKHKRPVGFWCLFISPNPRSFAAIRRNVKCQVACCGMLFSGTADGKGNNIRSEVFALDEQKGTGGRGTEQKHTQYHGKNMVNSY